MEAVEYQDGVKLWTPRGEAVSRSQLWSTVLSVTEREEESVGTETLNEPGHSHCTV